MAHMFKCLKVLVGCELRVSMGSTQGLRGLYGGSK